MNKLGITVQLIPWGCLIIRVDNFGTKMHNFDVF